MEVSMNIEHIDQLIAWIKTDQGKHFIMGDWASYLDRPETTVVKYEYCNTAFCLAGWIDQHLQRQAGATDKTLQFNKDPYEYVNIGSAWLGIERRTALSLFYMNGSEYDRNRFDSLPEQERSEIAIKVLEHLKATGEANWPAFLPLDEDEDEDEDE
jgi:hypothetical protein